MSYDLFLLERRPGEDPMDVLERLEEDEDSPTEEEARLVHRLGAALRAAVPAFEDNAGDAAPPHQVHLVDPEGLEVSVYHHSMTITFPYWESLDVDALTRDIAAVAAVAAEHTDWQVYDPQQEEWTHPTRDPEGFRAAFDLGRAKVREILDEQPEHE